MRNKWIYLAIKIKTPKIREAATKPTPKSAATIPVLRKTETVANSFPLLSDIEYIRLYEMVRRLGKLFLNINPLANSYDVLKTYLNLIYIFRLTIS